MTSRPMALALASARRGMRKKAGGPFGACITRGVRILAVSHNTVLQKKDPTCHAEINAIRLAARKVGRFDLSECEIYSTTEPCPMCFAAIHWARLKRVHFGTRIGEVRRRGFHELSLSSRQMKRLGKSRVRIHAGLMQEACRGLLRAWDRMAGKETY